mmetsp:Transcript_52787/g.147028  ORF Transcript_52787/g.147028 Transcript_52787/m.147028 type:complete len:483 (+) Transcript_52787:90-1538(+)
MMGYASLAILAACMLLPLHAEDDHDGHDHGDHSDAAYEWAGIFEVPDATYMWTAQKVDGAYADPMMKIAALPASAATEEQLDALAEEGEHALEVTCTVLDPGGVITPMAHACYQLHFAENLWQSLYTVDASGTTAVAFFTEHFPTEFESTAHYLKDSNGEDVEPMAELPEAAPAGNDADWGGSIGAAILVNLVTLIGVVLAVPGISTFARAHADFVEGVLAAFAAGSLLACAFFLLLFESTHLIAVGWTEEVDVLWRWGTMVLAGFLLPSVFESVTMTVITAMLGQTQAQVAEAGVEDGADAKETVTSRATRARVISAVSIGDFLHNFCDGIFIGAAFKGCGGSFAWGVALGTILHEMPQELADYAILTGTTVGMTPVQALILNFVAGLSVILGTVIINASDIDNSVVGLLLAFGGGTYVYLAAVECMPKVHQLKLPLQGRLSCLLSFVVGAILIGLILLDHKHCVPEAADGSGGGGHAHGH